MSRNILTRIGTNVKYFTLSSVVFSSIVFAYVKYRTYINMRDYLVSLNADNIKDASRLTN